MRDDERAALLRAICESPEDDNPRLAFADWLDRYGVDTADRCWSALIHAGVRASRGDHDDGAHKQEIDLALTVIKKWRSRNDILVDFPMMTSLGWWFHVRRGFLESATCSCDHWMEMGPRYVVRYPLKRIIFRDRTPAKRTTLAGRSIEGALWIVEDSVRVTASSGGIQAHTVPDPIARHLTGLGLTDRYAHGTDIVYRYRTMAAAEADMRRAAVAWARLMAGLDTLVAKEFPCET